MERKGKEDKIDVRWRVEWKMKEGIDERKERKGREDKIDVRWRVEWKMKEGSDVITVEEWERKGS